MHKSQIELPLMPADSSAPVAENRMLSASAVDKGATFSECRKYRYALWRIWDESKPLVMFIGLNPSTANEDENDNTIKSVQRISKHNGYGGFYMMNCFSFVSTNPDDLQFETDNNINDFWLNKIAADCKTIVFAWGNFDVVKKTGRYWEIKQMFGDEAVALHINKNGSPKHPLYCKSETNFVKWKDW
jgi:hypothetical protein